MKIKCKYCRGRWITEKGQKKIIPNESAMYDWEGTVNVTTIKKAKIHVSVKIAQQIGYTPVCVFDIRDISNYEQLSFFNQ